MSQIERNKKGQHLYAINKTLCIPERQIQKGNILLKIRFLTLVLKIPE